MRRILFLIGFVVVAIILFLTHDIIITNFLAYQICKADPYPKTFIKRTIEYPESIYWEDNIYPGFGEVDRLFMILNYLDGTHLKTLALNGPDGTIYVYTAKEEDWLESRKIKARKREGILVDTLNKEAQAIAVKGRTYTRQTMPAFNYKVSANVVQLTSFERRYLWSDEIIITDEAINEVVAYNRRLMQRWYMALPDFELGNRYYSPKPMCGFPSIVGFPFQVFDYLLNVKSGAVIESYNTKVYRKYNGGGR